jgi:hypothetical protein
LNAFNLTSFVHFSYYVHLLYSSFKSTKHAFTYTDLLLTLSRRCLIHFWSSSSCSGAKISVWRFTPTSTLFFPRFSLRSQFIYWQAGIVAEIAKKAVCDTSHQPAPLFHRFSLPYQFIDAHHICLYTFFFSLHFFSLWSHSIWHFFC